LKDGAGVTYCHESRRTGGYATERGRDAGGAWCPNDAVGRGDDPAAITDGHQDGAGEADGP
jgi:hypothetical protein